MAFTHKPDTGSIFKNDYKNSDSHPDYKGQVNCAGRLQDIALWVKTGKNDKKYFSVQLSDPWQGREATPEQDTQPLPPEPEDKIPF